MKELKLAFDTYASTLGGKLYGLHIYSYNETHKEREVQMIADSLTISTSTRGESVTHGLHASQLHVSLYLSLIHISEPTRLHKVSRMPSSA